MVPLALIRNVAVAGAAAAWFTAFAQMDANPSLYLFDKFIASDERLHQKFHGKHIWITGASSGIGAELAIQLYRHGANLVLSSRNTTSLETVADLCRQSQNNNNNSNNQHQSQQSISIVPFDMTASQAELEIAISQALLQIQVHSKANNDDNNNKNNNDHNIIDIESNNLKFDCIILNAGMGQLSTATNTSRDDIERMFRLNTLGPIALTQSLLQRDALSSSGTKHLMVTSSVGAKFGLPLSSSYAASKHALHGYYNSICSECPWLRVDLICPGTIDTPFHLKTNTPKNNNQYIKTTNGKPSSNKLKMSVERCASLMISSMAMNDNHSERWIAQNPTLFALYLNQYFPNSFQFLLRRVGSARVKAWQEGKDLYDPETWKEQARSSKK